MLRVWSGLGAALLSASAFAQAPPTEPPRHWHQVFRGSPGVLPPNALAPLLSDTASPFQRVVDITADGDGGLWLASLDGGAAHFDPATARFRAVRRIDGLPSDRVIVVEPAGNGAWFGTSGGLAQVTSGAVQQTWSDELPDPYVQTLASDGEALWIGTYRGLSRWSGNEMETVVQPWSVFFLGRGTDQRIWAGYEGLRGLPDLEPIEGVPESLEVYGIVPLQSGGTLLATLDEGVVRLHEGEPEVVWSATEQEGAYALAVGSGGIWAAGGSRGLALLDAEGDHRSTLGTAAGLPSGTVNAVHTADDTVWVGTEFGLARVVSDTQVEAIPVSPAAWPWRRASRSGRRVVFEGPHGAFRLTRRGLKETQALPTTDDDGWFTEQAVLSHRTTDGLVKRYLQVSHPLDWAADHEIVWVGTKTGLEVLHPESGLVVDALGDLDLGVAVVAVSPDGRGGCWLGTDTGQVVYTHVDDPEIALFSLAQDPLPTITSVLAHRKRGAWVTTDRGIFAVRR